MSAVVRPYMINIIVRMFKNDNLSKREICFIKKRLLYEEPYLERSDGDVCE